MYLWIQRSCYFLPVLSSRVGFGVGVYLGSHPPLHMGFVWVFTRECLAMCGDQIDVKTTRKSKALPASSYSGQKGSFSESFLTTFITSKFSPLGPQHWVSIGIRQYQKEVLVLRLQSLWVSKCSQPTLVLVFCSLLWLLVCTIQRAKLALMLSSMLLGVGQFH